MYKITKRNKSVLVQILSESTVYAYVFMCVIVCLILSSRFPSFPFSQSQAWEAVVGGISHSRSVCVRSCARECVQQTAVRTAGTSRYSRDTHSHPPTHSRLISASHPTLFFSRHCFFSGKGDVSWTERNVCVSSAYKGSYR